MKFKEAYFLLVILLPLSCTISAQESWQQFRGNSRNGSATVAGMHEMWRDSVPKLIWRKSLGSGFSELVVAKDKIYTLACEKADSISGSEFAVAFDAKTGEEVWRTLIDSTYIDPEKFGDGPRSTPAVDDQALYCLSSFGKLIAVSIKEGKVLWKIDFKKEFGSSRKGAYTSSPILYGDQLIVEVGGAGSRGYASFDKKSGKSLWMRGEGKPSYCSPMVAQINGESQIVFANDSIIHSFDKTGREIWSYPTPFKGAVPMPVFIAPNRLFVGSTDSCLMIEVSENQADKVFYTTTMRIIFSTSCHYGGYIYGISNGSLKCISAATGESKWAERGVGLGSLTRIDGELLVLTDKGVLKLVAANPAAYSELGSFQALTGKSWTAPSVANSRVYLRNLNEMACYELVYQPSQIGTK